MQSSYSVIGLMSGSSLDGIDLAHVTFGFENGKWLFELGATDCIPYDNEMLIHLKNATATSGLELWQLHTDLGHYFGKKIADFITVHNIANVDFVASHGHTVFHFPKLKFTTQIGDGATIAASSKQKVICDFRSADIANGGQGAPIVPIGEKYLFPDYKLFLNIGGIANISIHSENKVIAYDCCVANQLLNHLASQKGMEYDKDGNIASSGNINEKLLHKLNAIPYHHQPFPKSLDNGFSKEVIIPIVESFAISIEDKMATANEYIATQIFNSIPTAQSEHQTILITGGGAFNKDLVSRISKKTNTKVYIPDEKVVQFKEALILAFMGVLRAQKKINVLCSVTGATIDTINGAIYESSTS